VKLRISRKLFYNKTLLNVQEIQGLRIVNHSDGDYPDFCIRILLCNTERPQQSYFYWVVASNYHGLTHLFQYEKTIINYYGK